MIFNRTRQKFRSFVLLAGVAFFPSSPLQQVFDDETVNEVESEEVEKETLPGVPWQKPNYASQENALGYSADVFKVPPGMEDRVQFWRDIYTLYSTDQGVMHDTNYLHVVYDVVDFTEVNKSDKIPPRKKRKARVKLVEDSRKAIRERLLRLATVDDEKNLSGVDLKYWQMFKKINDKDKFKKAAERIRLQLGQKDRFMQGIFYSGRYLKQMEDIFKEEGLPKEITRLPFVESSFDIYARSRVGASGIWQFMRYTGRLYMKVGGAVDERNDPLRATKAAARMLRFNYQMLESWPLAITGYNHGPAGVKRQAEELKTRDLQEIIWRSSNRKFGFASENFYACFLAALEVERNADKFFPGVLWSQGLDAVEYKLPHRISFKKLIPFFGNSAEKAALYNPHLSSSVRRNYQSIPSGSRIYVPKQELANVEKLLTDARAIAEAEKEINPDKTQNYRVEKGDTLSSIAINFGVKIRQLLEVNDLEQPGKLQIGQNIKVPSQ